MASSFQRLQEDIVWAVQEGVGASYSRLHACLRVYSAASISDAINNLCDEGVLVLGDFGFEVAPFEKRSSGESEVSQIDVSEPKESSLEGDEAAEENTPDDNGVIDDRVCVIEGTELSASEENPLADSADSSSEFADDAIPEPINPLYEASKGSITTMTPVSFLDLPDHILQTLKSSGIDFVYQLVERLHGLGKVLGKDRLAQVICELVSVSGEPPVNLSVSDKRQLSILSGSKLFYFDWFGLLCSSLSEELDQRDVFERLSDGSFNSKVDGTFSFAEFSRDFQDDSVEANRLLLGHFRSNGYPINGDAFNIIMLPTVEEMVDEGAYERVEELVHKFLMHFAKADSTEKACFGQMRDEFLVLKERCDGLGSSERIRVRCEDAFVHAARKLDELEPCCRFDEDQLTLQCLPEWKGDDDDRYAGIVFGQVGSNV